MILQDHADDLNIDHLRPLCSLSNGFYSRRGDRIDINKYLDLIGYGHGRFTLMFHWRPDYDRSLRSAEYLGNIGRFHIVSQQQDIHWFFYVAAETTVGSPSGLKLNFGSPQKDHEIVLSHRYLEWMQKWYTIVVTAGGPDDFVDWQSLEKSGNTCVRFTIFDQETGHLLAKKDVNYDDVMPDLALLQSPLLTDDPYVTKSDCFAIRMFDGGLASDEDHTGWNRICNIWISYGTMWDPLAHDLDEHLWNVDRPNDCIGSAEALCNFCFSDIVKKGKQRWIKGSNAGLALFQNKDQTWEDDHLDAKLCWNKVCSDALVPRSVGAFINDRS